MNGGPGGFVERVGCGAKPTRRKVAEKGGEVEQAECTKVCHAVPFRSLVQLNCHGTTGSMDENWKKAVNAL